MEDIVTTLLTVGFLVFCLDQKIITSLQRQGKYDPDTHQTMLSRMFIWPFAFVLKPLLPAKLQPASEQSAYLPEGDPSLFSYDTTVCMDSSGKKTRLSYFFDDNQHAWYKVEDINEQGVATSQPKYEPAAVSFETKKLQFV